MKTKKFINRLENAKKVVPLQRKTSIGIWCNGNTTDSGPVILGSSPSIPTSQRISFEVRFLFASIKDKRIYKRLNLLYSILYAIDTSA